MKNIDIICPSRGRPDNVKRLTEAFLRTRASKETRLWFVIDRNDPEMAGYQAARIWNGNNGVYGMIVDPQGWLGPTLNYAHQRIPVRDVVGFLGDDHLPETDAWDAHIARAVEETENAIVYPNDGHQGANLPTCVFMDAAVPNYMGYFVPPGLRHLYIDNAWKKLGEGLGTLRYLGHVRIAHKHPHAGQAEWDEHYARVNDPDVDARDREAFARWNGDRRGLYEAVKRVQSRTRRPELEQPW